MNDTIYWANIYHGQPVYNPDYYAYLDTTLKLLTELNELPGTEWINYYSEAKEQITQMISALSQETRDEIEDVFCDANCDDESMMKFVINSEGHVFVLTVDLTDEDGLAFVEQ